MDIIEAMKERRSVRTFNGEPLTDDQVNALNGIVAQAEDPFGGDVAIRLKSFDLRAGYRPGTYGMIRGASDFFLVAFADDRMSSLSAGFRFEQVVLRAWEMGLGTCWIAGTFKDADFNSGEEWTSGERLRVVCPVGVTAEPRLFEKVARITFGSKNRKPFGRMFFQDKVGRPVDADSPFREALEMMRLAPSSRNSQPWHAVVKGKTVHFYSEGKSPLAPVDMGIGICHFCETERFLGRNGSITVIPDHPAPLRDWEYVATYTSVD